MAKKIIKKKTKVDTSDPWTLTDEKGLLLSEACKLDKEKKDIEKRLKEIKEELNPILKNEGVYSNNAGDRVTVSFREKYTDVEPKELYNLMKKKKLVKFFWKSVKVGLTEAKKYNSEKEINDLRKKLDPIKALSFK